MAVVILFACLFWVSFILMFWTYFGYPLLMYVWSKVAPKPIKKETFYPSITMLIPAYNEADVIGKKLENTVSLEYPKDKLQILVIDDGSDDGTAEIVQSFADRGVTLLKQPVRGGKMGAVNMGFEHATGEIVLLSDASPIYEKEALQKLVRGFADPSVGVIVGTLAIWDTDRGVAKQAGMYWKYEAALRKWESRTGSTVAVHGNMFAIRRHLHKPLQKGTINDEFSLAMEANAQGYRVVYEPEAMSYDEASSSMADEYNRRVRINAGRYQALFNAGYLRAPSLQMAFRLFSHKFLRPLSPVLMIIIFAANLVTVVLWGEEGSDFLLLRRGWGLLFLVGQIGFYLLAWLGAIFEKRGYRKVLIFSVPYFFVGSNFAALMGLWRWASGRQKVTWKKRSASS